MLDVNQTGQWLSIKSLQSLSQTEGALLGCGVRRDGK